MQWKEVPNTDGRYLISSDGKVFSVATNKLLKQGLSNMGYFRVEFNINGVAKKHAVHRLVAEAFVPNPNNLPCVNHKDENPRNNRADNLEWCTQKYNCNYGTRVERIQAHKVNYKSYDNVNSKTVYQYDLDGNFIAEYGSTKEAARQLGIKDSNISRVCRGERTAYKDCYFSYTKEFNYKPNSHTRIKTKPIQQLDRDGNLIREHEYSTDFKQYGFDANSIRMVCDGKMYWHKGYKFKYKE